MASFEHRRSTDMERSERTCGLTECLWSRQQKMDCRLGNRLEMQSQCLNLWLGQCRAGAQYFAS
jgi:hypothetical protein